jgi:phosphoglycolate phosphatase
VIRLQRHFDPQPIRLVIFDLDGTLIDSRLDLVHSVNAMLRHCRRPELPDEVIATYVGDGAPMLVRRALGDPDDQAFFRQALDFFLGYYREHKLDYTHVYDGVADALRQIRAGGNGRPRQMAVLSNKPVHPSRAIVQALGLGEFFFEVYGGNSFPTKKPDPQGALALVAAAGAKPEETLVIGDSCIDVLTGRNAGLWTCGVTYGFAPHTLCDCPPDVMVDTPQELGQLLQ